MLKLLVFSEFTLEFSITAQVEFAECSCLLSAMVNDRLRNARSFFFPDILSNLFPKI